MDKEFLYGLTLNSSRPPPDLLLEQKKAKRNHLYGTKPLCLFSVLFYFVGGIAPGVK